MESVKSSNPPLSPHDRFFNSSKKKSIHAIDEDLLEKNKNKEAGSDFVRRSNKHQFSYEEKNLGEILKKKCTFQPNPSFNNSNHGKSAIRHSN